MLEPNEFYQLLEEFYASKQKVSPTFRLGTIDLAYTSGLPKVLLDGDETVTIKEFSHLRNYTPTAGDKVVLALVGNTYIILGRIRNDPLQSTDGGGGGSEPVSVTWSDVTGKPTTFAPSAHSHPIGEVTGLQTALDGKAPTSHSHTWSEITSKPTTFAPSAHSHPISEVIGLQTALDGKSNTGHTHSWSEITSKPTTFTPSAHTHPISEISNFPSQSTHGGKFLSTDGTNLSWQTVSAGITEVDWVDVLNKPTTFPPSAHSHSWTEITSKPTTFTPSAHTHSVSDLTNFPSQATNSGKLLTTNGTSLSWSEFTLTGMTTWHDVLGSPNAISLEAHYHPISDVTGLQTALDGKSSTSHTHSWAEITGKPTTFTPSSHTHLWADITDKPSTFTPSAHTHAIADVTGLQGALDGKSSTSHTHSDATTSVSGFMSGADKTKLNGIATNANNYSHPTGDGNLHVPATGTTNNGKVLRAGSTAGSLSWGSVAWTEVTGKPTTFSPSAHTHAISDVTGLQTALDGKSSTSHTHSWTEITSKPTTFAPSAHTHPVSEISNFPSQTGNSGKVLTTDGTNLSWVTPSTGGGTVDWADIVNKPSTFPPSTHTHADATTSVSGFMSASDKTKLNGIATNANNYVHPTTDGNKHVPANGTSNNNKVLKATATAGTYTWGDVAWTEVTGKPTTFTPSTHTHLWADITDKPTTFAPSSHTHPWSEITDKPTGYTPSAHNHSWSDITSGLPWTFSGFDITQTNGDYFLSKLTGSFWAYAYRPRVATDNLLIRSDSEVRAFQSGSTSYIPVRASSFPTGSSINFKTNLEDLRDVYDPIEMIKTLRPYKYYLITDLERHIYDKPKVGFISEMVEPIFRDEDGVDTYSIETMHVGATQDLIGRVESLEKTVLEQQEIISVLIDELNQLKGGDSV